MKEELKELTKISRFYGNDPEFVIAGGGNTSFKNEDKLWVKASGISMEDIDEDGFVCLSRKELKKISMKCYSQNSSEREARVKKDLNEAILFPTNKRPSVETSMHEIIDFPFVVHTHPTLVNALMCSKNAKKIANKLFGTQALYVEYTNPGYVLFKKVEAELIYFRAKQGKEPSIIFLENHGVFVGGNSTSEIMAAYEKVMKVLKGQVAVLLPENDELPSEDKVQELILSLKQHHDLKQFAILFRNSELIQYYLASKETFDKVNKPFTPDDIVYCKSKYLFVSNSLIEIVEGVKEFNIKNGYFPKVVAIEGIGLLAIEENAKSAQTVIDVFLNMMKVSFYSDSFGGPQFMNKEQIDFIDNWEVENYRRQVAKKS